MFEAFRTSPIDRPAVHRQVAGLALLVTVAGSGLLAGAQPAAADIAQQIRDTQAQLDVLNSQGEAAAERYNAGRIALAGAQQQAAVAQARLTREDATLAGLRVQAGQFAAGVYMSGPAGQGMAIMSGTRPDQVLSQLGTLSRISRSQSDVLAGLATARHRQASAAAAAQAAVAVTVATVRSIEDDKRAVERSATRAQALLADLQVQQAKIIQAAKDVAARRAAQARAAALAEQARQTAAALAAFRAQPVAVEQPAPQPVAPTRHTAPSTPAPQPAPRPAPAPSGDAAQTAVRVAMQQLGKSYVWGASGPDHFDCSGLTMFSYAAAGISLSHFTGAQWNEGRHVSRGELRPGDLVFFEASLGHMGMYIGNGQFIHAPHTGDVVKISFLSGYYANEYAGAVRVVG